MNLWKFRTNQWLERRRNGKKNMLSRKHSQKSAIGVANKRLFSNHIKKLFWSCLPAHGPQTRSRTARKNNRFHIYFTLSIHACPMLPQALPRLQQKYLSDNGPQFQSLNTRQEGQHPY